MDLPIHSDKRWTKKQKNTAILDSIYYAFAKCTQYNTDGKLVVAFSSLARILGECLTFHYPPAPFFFFFWMEISSRALIPLFRPGSVNSDSASWDDCGRKFSDKLRVSSFPDRFPHRLHGVKSICVLSCNLPPALLAEWPGSFTCYCGNLGLERAPNKSQHTKLTLERKKKISLCSCRDSNLQPFHHESGALTNKLSKYATDNKGAAVLEPGLRWDNYDSKRVYAGQSRRLKPKCTPTVSSAIIFIIIPW